MSNEQPIHETAPTITPLQRRVKVLMDALVETMEVALLGIKKRAGEESEEFKVEIQARFVSHLSIAASVAKKVGLTREGFVKAANDYFDAS